MSRSSLVNRWLFAIFLLILTVDSHAMERKAIDFHLNNWDGRSVSLHDFKGKVLILTFSYAYCSAVCPIITGRLFSLDKEMNAPRNVVYLHVSIDPDMDTPERRKKYFNLYGIDAVIDGRWMFVSGQKSVLANLWKFYGITIKKIIDSKIPEGYYMQYTPKVVIIDGNGFIRHETGFDFSEEDVKSLIKKLTAAPSVKFAETRFEFGSVKEGEIVRHDFEFINEGNDVLRIVDLIPA